MQIVWDSDLVVLSVLTAMFGAFAALSHAERMRETQGWAARAWMIAGGVTLGMAIWSMHFIGMLAFHLPIPIAYDLFLTFISVLPAVVAALLGFYLLQSTKMQINKIIVGGIFMGIGIAAMHYTGMAALKMQPAISYDPLIFFLSILIAIVAAIGAMLIVYVGEKSGLHPLIRHFSGAFIMAFAIAGMHYVAMAGATFAPGSVCTVGGERIEPTLLAFIVAASVFLLFSSGWIANLFDRRMARQNAEALHQLRNRTSELEMDREILQQINQGLPLNKVLEELVLHAEALHPAMRCSILLLDKESKHLLHGAAPSLPDVYNKALDGLEIGQGVGSCGTSAFSGERVIVEDVQQHPYWVNYQELAKLGDVRACWSQPIKDSENHVFGTFAIYHRQPAVPSAEEIALIERYAHLAQLVIQRKEAEDEIKYNAFHDLLTHLPNRRLLLDRLQQALSASVRSHRYGAVLFIDLDNFKLLNDTKGHAVGDLMLAEVAPKLQSCVREGDTVARLGGDEFVIMLIDLDESFEKAIVQTEKIGEKIRQTLNVPCILNGDEYHGTASIGISLFCGNTIAADELLRHADSAMYQSKRAGRDTSHFFNPSMQEALQRRSDMQIDLRKALTRQQLSLHYQIQVNSEDQTIGAEVLLRWNHPVKGLIAPNEFIPLAEETGLILPIGHYVMLTACQQLKRWESSIKTQDIMLAINVSSYQLYQADFVEQVLDVLQQTQANPERLKLELTESMVIHNVPETIAKLQKLKAVGVSFAIDDFGTGYSSLAYLKRFPIQQLKIDRSFVSDIATNSNDATIVKTIIAMGDTLGLEVIAEGVETEAQLQILKQHDCHVFQGYLFSKPLPLAQFEQLLMVTT